MGNNGENEQEALLPHKNRPRLCCPYIMEPMFILYSVAAYPMHIIDTQLLYLKVGQHLGIDVNNLTDNTSGNISYGPCDTAPNSTNSFLREKVQKETSSWDMYISVPSYALELVMLIIYGSFTDRIGRRFLFILAPVGSLFHNSLSFCIYYFDLSVYFFLLRPLEYLFGNMMYLNIAAFAFLADTIPDTKERSKRMVILDVSNHLVGGIGVLAFGFGVKQLGFFWPILLIIICKTFILIYAILFIPETLQTKETLKTTQAKSISCGNIFGALHLFKKPNRSSGNGRRFVLLTLSGSFLLSQLYQADKIATLFQMNSPLCWGPLPIGIYNLEIALLTSLGAFIGTMLRSVIRPGIFILLGRLLDVVQYIAMFFVHNDITMFLAPVFGLFTVLPLPLTRAVLSGHFQANEQGSLFAIMSCIYVMCEISSKVCVNMVYSATVHFCVTFIFLVAAVFSLASAATAGWYLWSDCKGLIHPVTVTEGQVIVNDGDQENDAR